MNLNKVSFKDFEDIPNFDVFDRASAHMEYLDFLENNGFKNYLLETDSGCGPTVKLAGNDRIKKGEYISLVSNDYLGFTQHPKVKQSVIEAIEKYGTGAGSSPLIGGYYDYHKIVEDKISTFFNRPLGSTVIYTTGYTANSASLLCLLKSQDIAIVDMAVHSSVYEGISGTTTKRFLHNDTKSLEHILSKSKDKYRTKMVVIDGVYSQDGDIAKLKEILEITHHYGGVLLVDDAHGIGVVGNNGRGAMELYDVLSQVDFITGTFSKTLANIGGFFVSNNPDIVSYLRYQSRQYAFSASAPASVIGVKKALDLIDEEPHWRNKIWENINYLKKGFETLGLNIGTTESAIIPVKIGNVEKNSLVGKMLLENGIYTNPIMYPAVSLKDSRIRMSVLATHTFEHLDKVLNTFEHIDKKIKISK
ncbi:aminotransferase class I/II-fold pyridoxal phosphate-dependent enzyme [Riemerella anatipestifer]|uniref:Aminotransferase class I/II-fold pyridoxal phosphate-dependent enzyme n=2 Tax=Weeksellaceae TaxID=2762318 RepID=A0AAP3AJT5_RIEAN|nr:aminotransferase class I/II-fold pyridoxal phosphate-dependent enzyme [Riemerella anatipestifer]AZZ58459.1 aminotransferase class V-fold PLP-dependent enzyme [Riemerella anatipestifer]MBO4232975.1 aminotransferase class I/II-fold pyridoxal phosphate-dependent enzyme [Riemerella anatipestifer]MBT0573101.1 aminotransferase class I/II-fold pyridoxal phosphate-dependent enzyme [Riemerella anatipestifer]MCU7567375.1 aminotransferase class I/II-fold pyridoxal phosphate-dependent enzyme [Riemerella